MAISDLFPAFVPSLPNLCFEAGKRKALQIGRVPNLPNLPNLFTCTHIRVHVHARLCVCVNTNIGWEGWEGWEELAAERVSGSQPQNRGWEGWEKAGNSLKGSQ